MDQTTQKRLKRAQDAQGIHKLAVFFLDHKNPNGQAYYFYSTLRQDQNRTAKKRLKWLVETKWNGRVNWAGLYVQNQLVEQFKIADNQWHAS